MHSYTSIYHFCMDLFQKAGIRLHLLRTARMESIISAVAVHEGISLLPEENFRLFQYKDIVSVPIEPAGKLSIGIAGKKAGTGFICHGRISPLCKRLYALNLLRHHSPHTDRKSCGSLNRREHCKHNGSGRWHLVQIAHDFHLQLSLVQQIALTGQVS